MDFISNNKTDDHNLNQKSPRVTLFKFELNRLQSIVILILALTGLFLVPVLLGEEIFINLFYNLFVTLPSYFSPPPPSHSESFLFNMFAPNITKICIFILFLYLSFITVRKLIRGVSEDEAQKPKIIPQDRVVKWLGFKLTHGQAIFIFSLSLMGIPFLALAMIGINSSLFTRFYRELCYIPIYDHPFPFHEITLDYAPITLNGIFFIMCLYSIFKTRRGKKFNSIQLKNASNFGLFIFIMSFIVFVLFLIRLLSHLIIYTDLAYLIGITPESPTPHQFNDLLTVIIILIVSILFLIFSHFLKNSSSKLKKKEENLSWFNVTLTKNRFLLLTTYTIMYSCLIGFLYAVQFFSFRSLVFPTNVTGFYYIFFLLFLYNYTKINNKNAFEKVLDQFNDSDNFRAKWMKLKVNRLQSIIICSIASGAMIFYLYYMISIRATFEFTESSYLDMLYIVQLISMLVFLCILLLFALFTIKCTFKAIK